MTKEEAWDMLEQLRLKSTFTGEVNDKLREAINILKPVKDKK